MTLTHVYRWRKWRPELFGLPCRIIARGEKGSVLVAFADGTRHVASRWALRRLRPRLPSA